MGHLVTIDDLGPGGANAVVRVALQIHDRPGAWRGALAGEVVALVHPPPRAVATKLRIASAAARVGADLVVVEAPALPLRADQLAALEARGPRAVVVAGAAPGAVRSLGRLVAAPCFHAGTGPDDPWTVLTDVVADELVAAHHARGAVDGPEELRREAVVPTAAAVLAVLAGVAMPTIDLREEPSHWFG